MSGLPRTSAKNDTGKCTGDWACDRSAGGSHCVCWWDSDQPCCQCDDDSTEEE